MDNLSDKQKANRAYYWKNAEKIREQKRTAYRKKVDASDKTNTPKIKHREPVFKSNPKKTCTVKKRSARQRIEDFKITKELEIEYDSYL